MGALTGFDGSRLLAGDAVDIRNHQAIRVIPQHAFISRAQFVDDTVNRPCTLTVSKPWSTVPPTPITAAGQRQRRAPESKSSSSSHTTSVAVPDRQARDAGSGC